MREVAFGTPSTHRPIAPSSLEAATVSQSVSILAPQFSSSLPVVPTGYILFPWQQHFKSLQPPSEATGMDGDRLIKCFEHPWACPDVQGRGGQVIGRAGLGCISLGTPLIGFQWVLSSRVRNSLPRVERRGRSGLFVKDDFRPSLSCHVMPSARL